MKANVLISFYNLTRRMFHSDEGPQLDEAVVRSYPYTTRVEIGKFLKTFHMHKLAKMWYRQLGEAGIKTVLSLDVKPDADLIRKCQIDCRRLWRSRPEPLKQMEKGKPYVVKNKPKGPEP